MALIEQLNRALELGLGSVRGGTMPRFKWAWAPDLPYWQSRLGKVWVLCQWEIPKQSETAWNQQFRGRFPYPAKGMYHAMPETAITKEPTGKLTANYIRVIDWQLSQSYGSHLAAANAEIAADEAKAQLEWTEEVQDWNPAFSNFASGDRGNHVSFGGV